MNDIKIFDKIIPQGYANQIEEDITRTGFPWWHIDDVTNPNYGDNSGFVHLAYNMGNPPSEWFPFFKPLVYSIEEANEAPITKLLRIRVGFLLKETDVYYNCNTPHVDFTLGHYTACYYVNDSDGDTVLFDQKLDASSGNLTNEYLREYTAKTAFTEAARCSPKKGRLCVFDGLRFHASSKPKINSKRFVITVNYI